MAAFRHSGNTSHSDLTSQTSRFADIPAILEYPIGFRGRSNVLAKSVLAAKLCLISAQPATLYCFNTAASELECSCLSAKLCRFWRPFYAESDIRRSHTYLGERYRRLKKRRGSKRAALAVGHDILVIYYQMMKTGQEYREKGEEFFHQGDRDKVEHQLVQRLKRMGYQITRPPQSAA